MKLKTEISVFISMILFVTVGSITMLSYFQIKSVFKDQLEEKLLIIADYAAEDYLVKDALSGNNSIADLNLNNHIEGIRTKSEVDFIVVFDMDGTRLTHPNTENIGLKFKGGDEIRVLEEAERYTSKSMGTLGLSIRAFAPIFYEGNQIGAVCVGSTVAEVNKESLAKIEQFYPVIIVSVLLSISFAIILTTNIKDEILGLEPKEITLMLKEKDAILVNVKEGIITLNEKGDIIQYNKEAARILGFDENIRDMNTNEIIQKNKLIELLKYGEQNNDIEVKIRPGVTILCKYNILKDDKNHILGKVINFRDLTEVKELAEELTGIKKMAWSLRAQNHEFSNKLHTISGLIQLEEYEKAIHYISNVANNGKDINVLITDKIKNVSIAALILAKYYKAEELRISLEIDRQSNLSRIPVLLSEEDLGSVIGNLIENSLDAVAVDGTGKVYVKISEDINKLIVEISDNGPGIPDDIKEKVFERNFSTKSKQRGYGMFIVKKIVEHSNGKIVLTTDSGTSWRIEFPMGEGVNI